MVRVFYNSKTNAYLGGQFFNLGVAEFTDEQKGIDYANTFYLKYEVVEKPKKRVKKSD